MSRENVEVVRRFYDAYNTRDIGRCAALITADFELRSRFVAVEGGTYRGADGLRLYFDDLAEAWAEFWLEVEDIRDAGEDWVVGLMQVHARGGASGVVVDPKIASIFDLRGRRIFRIQVFMDRAEALEAAGLRE